MAAKGFHEDIRQELVQLVEEYSLSGYPEGLRNGKAFELWCLDLLGQWHTNLDTDAHDLPDSGDGGVDILLEDVASNRFILAQCAYTGKSGRFNIDKFGRLCELADDIADEDRVISGAYGTGVETKSALRRVARRVKEEGASVDLLFITTATAADEHRTKAAALSEKLGDRGIAVHLWDGHELRKQLVDVAAIEAAAIDEVTFSVPAKLNFKLECGERAAYVVALKASAAAALYDKHQQRLLAWNIRSYLGSNTINSSIRDTAISRGDEFFLCNNGVTAIAKEIALTVEGGHHRLVCRKFQVINGGQTLASLNDVYKAPENRQRLTEFDVLFTIIETDSVSPNDPFNQRIIQARNTQNKVLLSDFRSNDPIQQWLAKKLPGHAASLLPRSGPGSLTKCRKIFYKPKRDFVREPGALKLQLEDLAKIRYAYLHDPWTILAYVNHLWTRKGEETKDHPGKKRAGKHDARGKYELAFGRLSGDGEEWELTKTWDDFELTHCVFAVVVYSFITAQVDEKLSRLRQKGADGALTKAETDEKAYLTRARYHMVALAGEKFRSTSSDSMKKLMADPEKLLAALTRHWKICCVVLSTQIGQRLETVGRDSVLRDPTLWKEDMIRCFKELDTL